VRQVRCQDMRFNVCAQSAVTGSKPCKGSDECSVEPRDSSEERHPFKYKRKSSAINEKHENLPRATPVSRQNSYLQRSPRCFYSTGLSLIVCKRRMVLAAPGPLLTPPPSSSPPKTPQWSYSAQIRTQNEGKTRNHPPPLTLRLTVPSPNLQKQAKLG
jgi:hypothetical protein